MTVATKQDSCNRCGNCCKQGGPALHKSDLDLVHKGVIPLSSLITIRKGELIQNPVAGDIQPAKVELVKIVGTGRQWDCCFYDEQEGCSIYEHRPQACVLLKCWDTKDIMDIIEKETLNRIDLLTSDDPQIPVINEHERICPSPDFMYIKNNGSKLSVQLEKELERKVRDDLGFRTRIIRDFKLKLSEELFYFGRPLFQLLQPLGAVVTEFQSEITLKWKH